MFGLDRDEPQTDPEKALELAKEASRLAGGKSAVHLWLVARCYHADGQVEAASKAMRRAIRYAGEDSDWYETELRSMLDQK